MKIRYAVGVLATNLVCTGLCLAGISPVVSFAISTVSMGVLGFTLVFRPLHKLIEALKPIDFELDCIDFQKLDELEYYDKDMQFILDKFHYLSDAVSIRIDAVNKALAVSETDGLTGCKNRIYLDNKKGEYAGCKYVFVIYIDVNNLKKMNDIYGHEAGDVLIKTAAEKLKYWDKFGDVYRMGGDEFMVVLANIKPADCEKMIRSWYPTVGAINRKSDGFQCRLAYGTAWGEKFANFDDIMKQADARMYEHKKKIKLKLGEPLTREESESKG